MTVEWNPLLPDKSRSGGWGSSFNAIKEHLKMTAWSLGIDPDPGRRLSKKLIIWGMYRTFSHWFTGWERKQTCHYLWTRCRKITEDSWNHNRAQMCQNEQEIQRNNIKKLSFGSEMQFIFPQGRKTKLYKSSVVPAALFPLSLFAVLWVLCKTHFCSFAFDFRRAFWTIP